METYNGHFPKAINKRNIGNTDSFLKWRSSEVYRTGKSAGLDRSLLSSFQNVVSLCIKYNPPGSSESVVCHRADRLEVFGHLSGVECVEFVLMCSLNKVLWPSSTAYNFTYPTFLLFLGLCLLDYLVHFVG